MKLKASLLFASVGIGFFALVAAPAVSQVEPQEPTDEVGGLALTEEALGALGRLADMPEPSLRKKAIGAYNLGLEYRNKAWKLEQKAATADGEKAAKKAAKAQKSYKRAIEQFRMAVEQMPDFYQALGSLGYALLKTGQYEEALEAYNRALEIGPIYPEAIEERAEAFLGLDRIEEAKGAYRQPIQVDRECAAALMPALKRWLHQQRGDAGGLSDEAVESFAVWIKERSEPIALLWSSQWAPC